MVADTLLASDIPHTLRRTVGTVVAHSVGLDDRGPWVTARHYAAETSRVIDVRDPLDAIFA